MQGHKRRDQLQHLFKIMQTSEGREYFWDLLSTCHIYTTSFSSDPYRSAFLEGERNVGIRITADLVEAAPEQYLEMLKEFGSVRRTPNDSARNGDTAIDGADLDDGAAAE